jgi:hypothetical protein
VAGGVSLGRYSLGVGDRFAHEAAAQLKAFEIAAGRGVAVTPVWNKSDREHRVVGSQPAGVRAAADAAVAALGWERRYFVDADHVTLASVDRFLEACDFFTLDVSGQIGTPPAGGAVDAFLDRHPELAGRVEVAGLDEPLALTRERAARAATYYLAAAAEAGRVYRHVAAAKGAGGFVTEVSLDETPRPQTPAELLVILAALADEGVPLQTIAPRFSGRFNKGVEYSGDVALFESEFVADVAVAGFAARAFGLPASLKLSVHSGSDKFAIFPAIRRSLRALDAGVHVKTSGTTWLEELIGLAEAGGDGLALAQQVYAEAYARRAELCAPYAEVIDIRDGRLPAPEEVRGWTSREFAAALRHDQTHAAYSPDVRQLLHVGYRIAAELGERYAVLLRECRASIERNVTENLYERHLKPLFVDE